MSIVFEYQENPESLVDIVERYNKALSPLNDDLKISGKRLDQANIEHASLMSYYDERRIELNALLKHIDIELQEIRGKMWRSFTEVHSVELSTRDKDQYLLNEPAIANQKKLYNIVCEIYEKYESAVELFKQRGFALRNITNIRVAALEDVIL